MVAAASRPSRSAPGWSAFAAAVGAGEGKPTVLVRDDAGLATSGRRARCVPTPDRAALLPAPEHPELQPAEQWPLADEAVANEDVAPSRTSTWR